MADNPSSFTKLGVGIDYESVGSLLIQENLIFRTASLSKNYECLTDFIIFLIIGR